MTHTFIVRDYWPRIVGVLAHKYKGSWRASAMCPELLDCWYEPTGEGKYGRQVETEAETPELAVERLCHLLSADITMVRR